MAWNCTIVMTRESGIELLVEDEEQQRSTRLQLLGERVTLTVKDQSGESTVTQEPKRLHIVCSEVTVEADKLRFTIKDDLHAESQNTMVLKSQNQLQVAATDISVKADASLKLDAAQLQAKASATLTLASDLQAGLKGTQVAVSSDGMLDLAAQGIATLKGALINVSGNLINLG